MKKLLSAVLGAAMASSLCLTPVMAEEVSDSATVSGDFSFALNGVSAATTLTTVYSGTDGSESWFFTIDQGDGSDLITIDMTDLLKFADGHLYVNVSEICNFLNVFTGTDYSSMLSMLGVTEDYLDIVPLNWDALTISTDEEEASFDFSDFDEETLSGLAGILLSSFSVEADDVQTIYTVNNETLQAAADAAEEWKNTNLDFLNSLTFSTDTAISIPDLKPVFREYIDAVATGYAAAYEGISVEDASSMIDSLIDSILGQGLSLIESSMPSLDVSLDFSDTNISEAAASFLAAYNVDFTVITSDEGFSAEFTLNDTSIAAIRYSCSADGLLADATIGGQTCSFYVTPSEDGLNAVMTVGELTASVALVPTETGYAFTALCGEQSYSGSFEMTEDGFAVTLDATASTPEIYLAFASSADTIQIGYSCGEEDYVNFCMSTENENALSVITKGLLEGNTFSASLNLTVDTTTPAEITAPESSASILDILSSFSYLYFYSTMETETSAAQ